MKIAQGKITNTRVPYHTARLIQVSPKYPPGMSPRITSVELEIGQGGDRALWVEIQDSDPHIGRLIDLLTKMKQRYEDAKADMARETEP